MLRRSRFLFYLLLLIQSVTLGQIKNIYPISLDTNCVFSSDVKSRDLNKWYLMPDTVNEMVLLGPLNISLIDSITFFNATDRVFNLMDSSDCKELNRNSDDCIVFENDHYKWMFSSQENNSSMDLQLVGFDTRRFYKLLNVMPTYLGFFPNYNLAVVNLVDENGAYAFTNLIDLKSGKMIGDLSEYDNGTDHYMMEKNFIAAYSTEIFDSAESEIHLIRIANQKSATYCLSLIGTLVIDGFAIDNFKWVGDNTIYVGFEKKEISNQQLFLKVVID